MTCRLSRCTAFFGGQKQCFDKCCHRDFIEIRRGLSENTTTNHCKDHIAVESYIRRGIQPFTTRRRSNTSIGITRNHEISNSTKSSLDGSDSGFGSDTNLRDDEDPIDPFSQTEEFQRDQRAVNKDNNCCGGDIDDSIVEDMCESPAPKRYPTTWQELLTVLDAASQHCPANVPMLVVQSFAPSSLALSSRKEASVVVGMMVNALYRNGHWVFVRTPQDDEGFEPSETLAHIRSGRQNSFLNKQPLGPFRPTSGNHPRDTSEPL